MISFIRPQLGSALVCANQEEMAFNQSKEEMARMVAKRFATRTVIDPIASKIDE